MYIVDITILYDYIVRSGKQNKTLCFNHILRKSINKYCMKAETIFISAFNAENAF
jgi:hypothetical protein